MTRHFDIIVVGAGHAGCEAALVSSRMGHPTLLITSNLNNIAQMSCNPAIGGLGKGHLVCEIDALGGEMGRVADATGIQFRRLNASKGPAVRGTRCQSDSELYKKEMRGVLESQGGLTLREGMVDEIVTNEEGACGVRLEDGEVIASRAVIVTAGTFLKGLIHIGLDHRPGGRVGDRASLKLSDSLLRHGLILGRLKTGTCPRLDGGTINFSELDRQEGDISPPHFSSPPVKMELLQVACYLTYTNEKTHEIIRRGLNRSPLYTGVIKSRGPRYCPSVEDKVVKFPERRRHQVFLEPEGLSTIRWYPNGISTSLPLDVQEEMVHSIEGLEGARIVQSGYGIEYDFIPPTQVYATLEAKKVPNLYLAGQILGTTGYEEAAALGLMAGINAVQRIKGHPPLILERSQAYIGVLIDDLVTKGIEVDGRSEPYRMFTSRAEYRLLLREDNADLRLRDIGYRLGLVRNGDYKRFVDKRSKIEQLRRIFKNGFLSPRELPSLKKWQSLEEVLRRPGIGWDDVKRWWPDGNALLDRVDKEVLEQVLIEIRYLGYIERQNDDIRRMGGVEKMMIPRDFLYDGISGLSRELTEKLSMVRPRSLGQASRIAGMTPAALTVLSIHIKQRGGVG